MAGFNSDLQNLFKNFQQLQKYNSKAFDANKDGVIDKKDKEYLQNQKNALLNDISIFDVNGDGEFNQSDVDMFVRGNVNGDKQVTKKEKVYQVL